MHNDTLSRVNAIREWLTQHNIDALLIPHEDEYLGEYVPAHNERLHWLTGFTGSAGAAVITKDKAAIFVDGRYTVQVTKQVPSELFEYRHLIEEPALDWIQDHLTANASVAIDPRMHSSAWLDMAQAKLAGKLELNILSSNPIDELWHDRPAPVVSDVRLMPTEAVGQSSESKRKEIAQLVAKAGADSAVITALDSICWLLNVRGLDVSRLPVLLSHVILHADSSVEYFLDPARLPAEFAAHVGTGVTVHHPEALQSRLEAMSGKKVLLDPAISNAWFKLVLQNAGASVIAAADPCLMPKAAKNEVEIAGMKACHIRDGVAMSKFLCWLDAEVAAGNLHDEATLADRLEAFRKEDPTLMDLSFDTISAAGGNAAMCHYNHENQPEPGKLELNTLYLVDSGGQYLDGTTDITRTIAIGQPSAEMIKQFTLALKGHIGVARARFPKGTRGYQIDTLARQHLWAEGYDYDHGTGHGVGHFLSVHEGPASISKKQIDVPLTEGMVLSNEPGYYRADAFGIRIENLELVVETPTNGDFPVLSFESLTRCPIDKRNINVDMLTRPELAWLNDYHQKVWEQISPLVDGEVKEWLREATLPLAHS
ncbi:aminopeptidase P family protein [Vibrio parahaemolyticus O1:K58]|uniref:aminopeptidase P family protein n=1 Tax=Vibrio parahaemolyticus TaxID=670 RepID=UPI0006A74001|nr:aminopeptidase P family protein [Vibrio parahaemolyticus]EJG0952318.1 aminopeptidase P family protein [Vibrio parahaemolyticus O1:K58]EHH1097042.1 aminopeptidase P family protein [Vibrio parahaemolyticus]EHR1136903.1 aminopeptidase P family protein [Vibrio parahaemolyticus]EHV9723852.1 aminopeptidase P family protein [Vibrio parahaemolyticus]EIZ1368733.1 aminopeptidase P family protein [Vibrio parahaemolyticus]